MRTKFNASQKSSPTPSQESLVSQNSAEEANAMAAAEKNSGPFMPQAFCSYNGHTSGNYTRLYRPDVSRILKLILNTFIS